jgi:hypothetical protein
VGGGRQHVLSIFIYLGYIEKVPLLLLYHLAVHLLQRSLLAVYLLLFCSNLTPQPLQVSSHAAHSLVSEVFDAAKALIEGLALSGGLIT